MKVIIRGRATQHRTVDFSASRNEVLLIEQRLLPHEFQIVALRDYRETARAIRAMIVRGAGAIAATAAYGLAQGARAWRSGEEPKAFAAYLRTVYETLKAARPTAVDPVNAMDAVLHAMRRGKSVAAQQELALAAAEQFADDQVEQCRALGEQGAKLIRPGLRILTHCNAGALAFVDIGTATAPLYAAHAAGRKFHVFCSETRPRFQGATLTAWELAQHRIAHHIIPDSAAGHLMQRGEIDLVLVGSDRVLARTGEVANKIGTYTKAVLAARHRIPFYVAIPCSTIDWKLAAGRSIPIEEREEDEVRGAWGVTRAGHREFVLVANPTSRARNPGFDVTPPDLITGIITPAGIFPPRELMRHRRELER